MQFIKGVFNNKGSNLKRKKTHKNNINGNDNGLLKPIFNDIK